MQRPIALVDGKNGRRGYRLRTASRFGVVAQGLELGSPRFQIISTAAFRNASLLQSLVAEVRFTLAGPPGLTAVFDKGQA